MSTPGFPLHPERIPAQHTYSADFQRWRRYERPAIVRKVQREALLEPIMNRKFWWNIVRFLTVPVITAIAVVCGLIANMSSGIVLTSGLQWGFIVASLLSCGAFGIYADLWTAKVKTRSDWALIMFMGMVSGAMIGITGIFIDLIPN